VSRRIRRLTTLAATLVMLAAAMSCTGTGQWGDYANDINWLCRPGKVGTNYCTDKPLDSTVVEADGSRRVKHYEPIDQSQPGTAPYDCFYAYPTVNQGAPAASLDEEIFVVHAQFARYSTVCNTYAPFYRQSTANGFTDVQNAFNYYLQHWNNGRKFVLIGHSQGTMMLTQLIAQRIDNNPQLRGQLISALLIGGAVQVPTNRDVGGSFQNTPLCHSTSDTGCVIAYNSFGSVGQGGGGFGGGTNGRIAACTNPAALGGGSGVLDNYLITFSGEGPAFLNTGDPMGGLPAAGTRYVELPGAMKAECVRTATSNYLHITTNEGPGDTRDITHMLQGQSGLGLHIVETNMTMGNLISTITAQAEAAGV
jgi:hypothetical protein